MLVHQIRQLYETYYSKVWTMVKTYTHLARQAEDYSEVRVNGVDETAARRGHDYVSLFVDIVEKRTIFVTEAKDQ